MRIVNVAFVSACLVLVSRLHHVNSDGLSAIPNPMMEESEEVAFQKLQSMETELKNSIEKVVKQILPMAMSQSSEANVSSPCMSSLLKLLMGVKDLKLWALKLIDSIGLPAGGLLQSPGSSLGSYSQCLDIVIPPGRFSKTGAALTGRYCVAGIRTPLPPRPKRLNPMVSPFNSYNHTFKTEMVTSFSTVMFALYDTPFKMGICVPSACSKEDLNELIQPVMKQVGLNTEVEFCVVKEQYVYDKLQIAIIAFYLVIVLINIFATIYDEISRFQGNGKAGYLQSIIQTFSIRRNIVSFLDTNTPTPRSLDCMNGLRYISTTWVVLGHAYLVVDRHIFRELILMVDLIGEFNFQAINNGFLSVESFMFITSVLLSYHIVLLSDSGKKVALVAVVVKRVLRLVPSLLFVISIMIVLPAFGSGPFFKELMEDQAQLCRDKWWHNALFIGNINYTNQICLFHTWYLSTEFQCFLVSLLYFFLLFKNQKIANGFLSLLIVGCVLSTGIVTYLLDLQPLILARYFPDFQFTLKYAMNVYTLPHVHLGIYAIGLYLGTFIARNPKVEITKKVTVIGWPVAFATALALVYSSYPWNKGYAYTMIESVIYSSLQRTVWGLCLAWVVLSCYAQKGGVVNSFLSWPALQPLVRLTYLIYLVHFPIYLFMSAVKLGNVDPTHYHFIFNFFGVLCSSHIIAFIIRILFESPVIQLQGIFFDRLLGSNKPKEELNKQKDDMEPN